MAVHIDYIIAVGLFLVVLVSIATFSTAYSNQVMHQSKIVSMKLYAMYLLGMTEREGITNSLNTIGVGTEAFRFEVEIENIGADITSEIVDIDMSKLGFGNNGLRKIDFNSFAIYEPNGSLIDYDNFASIIRFVTPSPHGKKFITVWFDDNSNFTPRASNLPSANNTINETVHPVQHIWIVQKRYLNMLSSIPYESLQKNYEFRLRLLNSTRGAVWAYGAAPAGRDVIVIEKPVIYQSEDAEIMKGIFAVDIWQ